MTAPEHTIDDVRDGKSRRLAPGMTYIGPAAAIPDVLAILGANSSKILAEADLPPDIFSQKHNQISLHAWKDFYCSAPSEQTAHILVCTGCGRQAGDFTIDTIATQGVGELASYSVR